MMQKQIRQILRVLFFSFLSIAVQAQHVVSPLDIPLLLSGNFGELRNDHFHSGLDFKTQGVTGLPVKAVKAGSISRISVSPYGYGRAVYINHPDGTTSVYGHLDRFAFPIESAVRDSQYVKESFSVNLYFSSSDFPLKQGEVFAYSGNSGGSGGPHLHFEFRDTATEKIFDPLPAFKDKLKDNQPPEIRGLLFSPQPGMGIVNGSTENQFIPVNKNKEGKYILSRPVKAWGLVGIGIKAYDKMDVTTNIYGVHEIQLQVDTVAVYHSVMDGFFFNETRYLNSFVDWKEWKEKKSFYMKSFIEPGNKLGIYRPRVGGIIAVSETKTYDCEYTLKDIHGNASVLNFTITGEEHFIPERKPAGILFPYNRDNEYREKGIALSIPQGNLYTTIYLNPDTLTGYSPFAPLYSFGVKLPLHDYCLLTLDITNDVYPDKEKYGVVSVVGNQKVWLGGEWEAHKMKIRIRELGVFSIVVDTVPPVVVPQNLAKWTANKRISFKISDELSGIDFYRGTLDGKFILFEYEPKNHSLVYQYDAKRVQKGKHMLTLIVRDGAGNETRTSRDVMF